MTSVARSRQHNSCVFTSTVSLGRGCVTSLVPSQKITRVGSDDVGKTRTPAWSYFHIESERPRVGAPKQEFHGAWTSRADRLLACLFLRGNTTRFESGGTWVPELYRGAKFNTSLHGLSSVSKRRVPPNTWSSTFNCDDRHRVGSRPQRNRCASLGCVPLESLPFFVQYGIYQRYVTSARWTAATDGTDEFLATYQ